MSPFEEVRESWTDTMNMVVNEAMRMDKEAVIEMQRIFLKAHKDMYEGFVGLIDKRLGQLDEIGEKKAAKKVEVK